VERIGGVDVARGLAVLGMMTAHVGVAGDDLWSGEGWLGVADGRSAALFAVLAGLSIALLSGGSAPVDGGRLGRARVRILTRAVLLFLLGTFLSALGAPIAVILQSYAVLFVLALPVLRVPPAGLVALAAGVALVAPPICFAVTDALTAAGSPPTGLVELLVAGYYPAATWLAYVLAGLAVGRSDLRAPRVRRVLLLTGVWLAVAGYGGGVLATRLAAGQPESVLRLLSTEPHADSTVEVAGNIGVALVVVATCLVVADRWPRVVVPLAATGALALTAYSTHIVVIALMGPEVVREPQVSVHLGFLVVTLVLATAWRATLGRGPLERAMHAISTSVADSVVDPGDRTGGGAPGGPQGAPGGPQGQTSSWSQPAPPRR
jgi:uncharacterized membrane protein YeiB